MRHAGPSLLVALVPVLFACPSNWVPPPPEVTTKSSAGTASSVPAVPKEAALSPDQEAVRLAKGCGAKDPKAYRSVGGSPLLYEEGRAHQCTTCTPTQRLVSIPEESPTTRPSGIDLLVDIKSGTCTRVPMD